MKKGQHMPQALKDNLRRLKQGKKLSKEHRAKVVKTLRHESGENNPKWKGGRIVKSDGYVLVRMPEHPMALSNGYVPEHRLVMEQKLGRVLERWEVVHHINGIKSDNSPENLVVLTHSTHAHEHWDDIQMREQQSKRTSEARAKRFWSTKKK